MRHYYSVDAIRQAEAPLLASLPDGALMRRAAYGLATEIIGELAVRTGGVTGRRVCAVVGSGDNGGDALWAATFLRRRGVAADAILLKPERTHRKGLAAFRRAGGRIVESVSPTTDLVVDGVVGISGSGALRPAAAEVFAAVDDARIPVIAVDIPSGIDAATGAITGPAVHASLTVTFGGLEPKHVRLGQVESDVDQPHPPAVGECVHGFEAAEGDGQRGVHRGTGDGPGRGVDRR
ncbi:NAD(P)H-hydrate epimerase, partial [Mycobacterium sp. 1165178.9]|uniref:NAD(P)H-hydrate epimerase n=1 Tax=Mycobacterium sp. 1165178.9 TaxID=1834070 RepID=UPI000A977851